MNALIAQLLRATQHTIIGRIGNEPEVRYFQSGTCKLQLSLAVNKPGAKRDDGQKPDWFKAELWGDAATAAADQLRKGDLLEVTGRVSTETWTNRNGEAVTDLVVRVERWQAVGAQRTPAAAPAAPAAAPPVWNSAPAGFDEEDDEVPF